MRNVDQLVNFIEWGLENPQRFAEKGRLYLGYKNNWFIGENIKNLPSWEMKDLIETTIKMIQDGIEQKEAISCSLITFYSFTSFWYKTHKV